MFRLSLITALLFFNQQLFSQLCQGSLGDPIVNITFGSGSNPGSPLAAAATGYSYLNTDCPNDGFYTVRTNTNGCFGNTWHNVSSDHTGNGNGYFMLVNASLQPSAFYVDTVRGLCGNSTYEFAAWVVNVILSSSCSNNPNQPNLTFTIERTDGTVLQTYNSGNIPSTPAPQWKQFGFFFTTPASVSDVVVRIVNNAAGGCGNDLALDDITFRPCGPQLASSIAGQSTGTVNICEGQAATYTFNCTVGPGFNMPVMQWQRRLNTGPWTDIAGATSTTLAVSFLGTETPGTYDYRLAVAEAGNLGSAQCRISSISVSVIVNANPAVVAGNNGPVCERSSLQLLGSGGNSYLWQGPAGYAANAGNATIMSTTLAHAGTYTLTATSTAGCTATATTTVQVNPAPVAAVSFTDTAVCFAQTIMLNATGAPAFSWTPSSGLSATNIANPQAIARDDIQYKVVVSNASGCTDSALVNLAVIRQAIANAGPDKNIISGGTTVLEGSISGNYSSFFWQTSPALSDESLLQPIAYPLQDEQYILYAVSKNNCGTTSDTVAVKIYKGIYIPNAFTPNNDGQNDTWNIPALDAYPAFELVIYNRYGQPVYQNSKRRIAWNGFFKGQEASPGVYTYLIKLNLLNIVLKGTVLLIR